MTELDDTQVPMQPPKSGTQDSTPTPPSGEPSTPPAATEPAATPASSPSPEEWRVPSDDPRPWARGKTGPELLGIGDQMYGVLGRFNQTGQVEGGQPQAQPTQPHYQQPTQPQPVAEPTVQPTPQALDPNDYVTGAQLQPWAQQQMQAFAQNQFNPQIQALARQTASANKAIVRQRHEKMFDKYGPEIESQLASLAPEAQTVDNLELVVKLVMGSHVDELVEAGMRDRGVVNMEPGLRAQGGATDPGELAPKKDTLEDDRIPQHWKMRAERAGITEDKVEEWCRVQGITKQQFYKDFERDALVADEA